MLLQTGLWPTSLYSYVIIDFLLSNSWQACEPGAVTWRPSYVLISYLIACLPNFLLPLRPSAFCMPAKLVNACHLCLSLLFALVFKLVFLRVCPHVSLERMRFVSHMVGVSPGLPCMLRLAIPDSHAASLSPCICGLVMLNSCCVSTPAPSGNQFVLGMRGSHVGAVRWDAGVLHSVFFPEAGLPTLSCAAWWAN